MSADNWAVCPLCKKRAIEAREAKQVAAGKAYGSVPSAEYLAMLKAIEAPLVFKETFREDYEISVGEDGEFFVSYRGGCTECSFSHAFKHTAQLAL